MSDETPTDPLASPPSAPPERARVEASAPSKRLDALPVLYLVGFVILAAALIYIWRHPGTSHGVAQQVAKVNTLQQEVQARKQENDELAARVQKLESRPAPSATPVDLGPIQDKLTQLSQQESATTKQLDQRVSALESAPKPDLKPLDQRISALEQRPQPKPVDLGPLEQRVEAVQKQDASATAAVAATLQKVEQQLSAVEAQQQKTASSLDAIDARARKAGRLQAASAALEAGQPLGDIPGAPPALAQFAHQAPPTEAGLKTSFDAAARAAEHASQPAIMDNQPFFDRMWTKAQQAVTVRQGDHVLLGDPIAGVLQHAREQLDAGDLSGAVKALDELAGPAKAAMSDWVARAKSLVAAREAIGSMAAQG